jgi:superfamily II DNA/RNA helicase
MAALLEAKGVTAMAVTKEERGQCMESILASFRNGNTSVLCCTGVLSRGFHVDDIRFVFHATLPLDLTEYIQQTGRAGRDGKPAHCILFYRAQDFASARYIKIQSDATEDVIKSFEQDVIDLASYAMSSKCRYSLLAATATIDQCKPSEQRCPKDAQCDNCKGKGFQTFELPLIHIFDSINNHLAWSFRRTGKRNNFRRQDSLSGDLLQFFLRTQVLKVEGNQIERGVNFDHVYEQLKYGYTRFVVKYDKLTDSPSTSNNCAERSLVLEVDDMIPLRPLTNADKETAVADPLDSLRIPFLVRFEAER